MGRASGMERLIFSGEEWQAGEEWQDFSSSCHSRMKCSALSITVSSEV